MTTLLMCLEVRGSESWISSVNRVAEARLQLRCPPPVAFAVSVNWVPLACYLVVGRRHTNGLKGCGNSDTSTFL